VAARADVALVCIGVSSGEGHDRTTLALPAEHDALVKAVAAAQPATVVAVASPGAVLLPWAADVPAVLFSLMAGQSAGDAMADVLFGDVNPSGRLPVTLPNKDNELNFSKAQYPGEGFPKVSTLSEGVLVGYRGFDAAGLSPAFAFGHGLSYTAFNYSALQLNTSGLERSNDGAAAPAATSVSVSFTVTNTGGRDGAEVAQLYLGFPKEAGEPPKLLRRFSRHHLRAGAAVRVSYELEATDLSVWDGGWNLAAGEFGVFVGASSRDLRLAAKFHVPA